MRAAQVDADSGSAAANVAPGWLWAIGERGNAQLKQWKMLRT